MPSELPAALQLGGLQLRQVQASDTAFLRALYRDVRSDELAVTGWPSEAMDAFCQSQFDFQSQHYRSYYPQAVHYLVERDGLPVGRLIVDDRPDEMRAVDISLIAAQRGQGLGSVLMQWLCERADAQQQPMALSVDPQNRARHWYASLGFVQLPGDGLYLHMRRPPPRMEHPCMNDRPDTLPSIFPPGQALQAAQRAALMGHAPCCIWLTGLSASGKTSLAHALERALHQRGCHTYALDGDNLRKGLNADLGFSPEARAENIRRMAHVARLMADAGLVVIVAAISPYAADRAQARALFAAGAFVEVFVDTPLAVCEARDPKGLYARARRGELRDFTGIDSPYERPLQPELHLQGEDLAPEAALGAVLAYLDTQGLEQTRPD